MKKNKQARILIDGDIICYQITSRLEEPIHWGDDIWTLHCDFKRAKAEFKNYITSLRENLGIHEVLIFLTSSGDNYRNLIYPGYKANRSGKRKPMCLAVMREWLSDDWGAITEPRLEADDLLGIYATNPTYKGSIIVSLDKDLRTIPGKLSADGVHVEKITQQQSVYNHATQVLTGDATDGYPGCPGIGPKTAAKLFAEIKPSKTIKPYWDIIAKAYEKAGQLEHDAMLQGRVAYILQWRDYDFKTKKVAIWKP